LNLRILAGNIIKEIEAVTTFVKSGNSCNDRNPAVYSGFGELSSGLRDRVWVMRTL